MKSILFVLLLAGAGTAVYFFVFKKKNEPGAAVFNKDLLNGTWKPVKSGDSTVFNLNVTFLKDGKLIRQQQDSVKADTSYYDWKSDKTLLFKEKPADTSGKVYAVIQLTKDSLRINTDENKSILLERMK